ncbi:hypothetical protein HMPREF9071_0763 [Capnocytophaga sp. oral taxon 338 str. F0234]|nr:hypothetical protein HMPREF9071_0763 [Capnocytophaga sp. oral taxon 338 str. F0234]
MNQCFHYSKFLILFTKDFIDSLKDFLIDMNFWWLSFYKEDLQFSSINHYH